GDPGRQGGCIEAHGPLSGPALTAAEPLGAGHDRGGQHAKNDSGKASAQKQEPQRIEAEFGEVERPYPQSACRPCYVAHLEQREEQRGSGAKNEAAANGTS